MAANERVVCFDLGGVLVRICRTWSEACIAAAIAERNPEWFASDAWKQRRQAVGDRYQCGSIDCDAYHSELAAHNGGAYTSTELRRIHDAWTLDEYPGALELVEALNALPSVTTACLSNTNHGHWVRLANLDGRREYPSVLGLRHQLASHLLGCAKPGARIFELAFAAFTESRELSPHDVFYFDDLEENVTAARAVGWSAFLVDHRGDTSGQMRRVLANAGFPI
jgi:FMN phosphatase YigB (HAD superfamily)